MGKEGMAYKPSGSKKIGLHLFSEQHHLEQGVGKRNTDKEKVSKDRDSTSQT